MHQCGKQQRGSDHNCGVIRVDVEAAFSEMCKEKDFAKKQIHVKSPKCQLGALLPWDQSAHIEWLLYVHNKVCN